MERAHYLFTDLESLPEQLFACLSHWADVAEGNGLLGGSADPLLQAQVALFEWMANLIQHASFGERAPLVQLDLELSKTGVACAVEDNSDGFDFDTHLARRRNELNPMPERGMGLLLLDSTAEYVSYDHLGPHRNRLSFQIPVGNTASGIDLTAPPDDV